MSRLIFSPDFKRTKTKVSLVRLWNKVAKYFGLPRITFMPHLKKMILQENAYFRTEANNFFPLFYALDKCTPDLHTMNRNGEMLFLVGCDPEANETMHKIMKEQNLTLRDWDKIEKELDRLNVLPTW